MNLTIRGVNYDMGAKLMEFIERRLRFALGRFAGRIGRVEVRFSDVNGPRGGVDKRCHIMVALTPHGAVRVEDSGHDPFALAARAAKRSGQAVHRALGRRHHRRELRARGLQPRVETVGA